MTAKLEFSFETEEELIAFTNRLKNLQQETKPATMTKKTSSKKVPESEAVEPVEVEQEKLVATQITNMSFEEFRNEATNIRATKPTMHIKPIMDKFGITKLTDLDPDKYEAFLEALRNG